MAVNHMISDFLPAGIGNINPAMLPTRDYSQYGFTPQEVGTGGAYFEILNHLLSGGSWKDVTKALGGKSDILNWEDTGYGDIWAQKGFQHFDAMDPKQQGQVLRSLVSKPSESDEQRRQLATLAAVAGAGFALPGAGWFGLGGGGGAAPAAAASGGTGTGGAMFGGAGAFTPGALSGANVAAGASPLAGGGIIGSNIGAGSLGGLGAVGGALPSIVSGAGSISSPGMGGALGNLPSWLQNYGSLITGGLGLVDALNQPDELTQSTGGQSQSTSALELPQQFQGAANQALGQLQGLPPYQVAGLPSVFNQAVDTTSQALSGGLNNPFAAGGQNAVNPYTSFAGGGNQNQVPTSSIFAGGQTINPYLDQVFNTAANSTQNRLATEFAHAGRLNSGSHQQARSQELQNLAAGIYAPGFEAERSRQYGASEADVSRQLAQREANLGRMFGAQESGVGRQLGQAEANLGRQFGATEANLGRMLGAIPMAGNLGQVQQQVGQQQLDAPYLSFLQQAGGLGSLYPFFPGTQRQQTTQTGQVTQPLFSNPLAGLAGGFMLGNSIFGRP